MEVFIVTHCPKTAEILCTPSGQECCDVVPHDDNETAPHEPQLALPIDDSGNEQGAQEERLIDKVAHMMTHDRHRQLRSVEQLATDMQCSRRTVQREIALVALRSLAAQRHCLEKFLDYVHAMTMSNRVEASLFCTRWRYDETPLKLRPMQSTDLLTTETQALKVFVVEAEWRALLHYTSPDEHAQQDLLVTGSFSPRLVPAQNSTGETIMQVLNKANNVPDRARELFQNTWRCVESDA
eukprot:2473074-Amphidinium_carterae.1